MIWTYNARILAILSVVFAHAVNYMLGGDGDFAWWVTHIYKGAVRWGVPIFIMLSGSLLLDSGKRETAMEFYSKRASRILIPILFWSVAYIGWTGLRSLHNGAPLTVSRMAEMLLSGRPYYHLWFLFMVVSLYMVTPFLRNLVDWLPRPALVALVSVGFMCSSLYVYLHDGSSNLPFFLGLLLIYVPYFLAGHLVRHSNWEPSISFLVLCIVLLYLATILGGYSYATENGWLISRNFYLHHMSFTVIPMSILLMFLLRRFTTPLVGGPERTQKIAGLVFGVYLIHPAILDVAGLLMKGHAGLSPVLLGPLLTVVVFLCSLLAVRMISSVPYLQRVV